MLGYCLSCYYYFNAHCNAPYFAPPNHLAIGFKHRFAVLYADALTAQLLLLNYILVPLIVRSLSPFYQGLRSVFCYIPKFHTPCEYNTLHTGKYPYPRTMAG